MFFRQSYQRNAASIRAREEERRERARLIADVSDVKAYERRVVRAALERLERDRAA